MDYKALKRQILIEIRGPLSQLEFSQKLGYSFNQVGKWESSATRMKWTEFYDVCLLTGIPLEKTLQDVFMCLGKDVRDPVNVLNAIHVFHSSFSFEKLSQLLHCHVSVVRRWFRGAVCPDIESVFALMDLREGFLSVFVSKLVNINNIPSIFEKNLRDTQKRSLAATDPDMVVVKLSLRLSEYKKLKEHSDEFISEQSSLCVTEVQKRIQILLDTNQIIWENNKLVIKDDDYSNLTGDLESFAKLQKHWIEKMLLRFDTPNGIPVKKNKELPGHQACYVFTASKDEVFQIHNLLNKCFEDIRQIVNTSQSPEEEIRVIMMSCFSPNDIPIQKDPMGKISLPTSSDLPFSANELQ